MPSKPLGYVPSRQAPEEAAKAAMEELVFLALPTPLFRDLSNEAARRQMTLAQFLAEAVGEYLAKHKICK